MNYQRPHTMTDRPAGCTCEPESWARHEPIRPVCDEYTCDPVERYLDELKGYRGPCLTCEHEFECHRKPS